MFRPASELTESEICANGLHRIRFTGNSLRSNRSCVLRPSIVPAPLPARDLRLSPLSRSRFATAQVLSCIAAAFPPGWRPTALPGQVLHENRRPYSTRGARCHERNSGTMRASRSRRPQHFSSDADGIRPTYRRRITFSGSTREKFLGSRLDQ